MTSSAEEVGADSIKRLFNEFSLYSFASLVPAVLGVILLTIFTRVFPPSVYGRYALTLSAGTIAVTLLFGWVEQAILRLLSEGDRRSIQTAATTITFCISLSVFVFGSIGYILFRNRLGIYGSYYVAAVALVITRGPFNAFLGYLQAALEPERRTRYKLGQAVLKFILSLALALVILSSITGWIWGSVVANIVAILAFLRLFSGYVPDEIPWSTIKRMFKYGSPLAGWMLGLTLLDFADRLLLEMLVGSRIVGIYSSNYMIVNRALPLALTPIIQAIHPRIMNAWDGGNAESVQELVAGYTRYFLIVGVPATIGISVLSRPLSTVLLAQSYQDAYVIIPIAAVGIFCWNLSMFAHKGLEIAEETLWMLAGVILAVISNLLLNWILIPRYGYVGAAIATLISFLVYLGYATLSSRFSPVPWIPPLRTIRNVAVAGAVMTVPGALAYLPKDINSLLLPSVAAVAGVPLYTFALYLLGEFKRNELMSIKNCLGM